MKAVVVCAAQATIGLAALAVKRDHLVQAVTQGVKWLGLRSRREWRACTSGAFLMGLRHGLHCLGCCWALMALLFVGGVMNLVWIAALSLLVAAEKLLPGGPWIGRAAGAALIAWAAATLVV